MWTRGAAENTHVIYMTVNLDTVLGSAGCINKRTSYHGKKHITFMEDANACPPGIAHIGHMV